MKNNNTFDNIFGFIRTKSLSEAMDALASFSALHTEYGVEERLHEIHKGYELMFDYWSRGYRDEHLDKVYDDMLYEMYKLTADTNLRYNIANSKYLSTIDSRIKSSGRDWSVDSVKFVLENFVTDVAMLELCPDNVRVERSGKLYSGHQQFMNDLFDYIWLSCQWSDSMADAFTKLVLSPTVDVLDQQLIISATMLGCMNMFDINKFSMMLNVFRMSTDEFVRQRALVGWALSLSCADSEIFAGKLDFLYPVIADESVRKELVELQIQLFNCINAETDNSTIQNEIMPDLLKHNGFGISLNGIEERDPDDLSDIINSDMSDSAMDKVEQSFKRMLDMQKAGADIYFGGFSQMKRFPFFDSISNWFIPFYVRHPAISTLFDNDSDSKMVLNLIENVPFCDSDKYSFMLAFKQVIERIPQNVREMLGNGHVAGIAMVSEEEKNTPAYIRRIYLQNLYRYFRLFHLRNLMYNPFDKQIDDNVYNYLFFAREIFKGTQLVKDYGEVVASLIKRKMYGEAICLLANYSHDNYDYNYYMFCGNIQLYHSNIVPKGILPSASFCYSEALHLNPDSEMALSGYARAKFYDGEYSVACDSYARLLSRFPDNKKYELNMCVCLVNLGQHEEALKHLYKLNYENPTDMRVCRVMARALLDSGRYEKADKMYAELCTTETCEGEDLVNYGLCAWLAGNKAAGAKHFVEYIKSCTHDMSIAVCRNVFKSDIIDKEKVLLSSHGITPAEIHLMSDLVCEVIFPA